MSLLPAGRAAQVFLILAVGYFLSSVMRGVTGTLAPTLATELGLGAGQLGLLAGSYFLGFAAMQLPLGAWLDRHGPRRVLVGLLAIAAVSCVAFALAGSFGSLLVARLLGGIGVSACLMAPLAGYRSWLAPHLQIRASSWMLMSGALGLVAATLPVQWALPLLGWRPLFVVLAALFVATIVGTAWLLPAWHVATHADADAADAAAPPIAARPSRAGRGSILRSRYFLSVAPLALIPYGSGMAIQTLWATQWMVHVTGYSPQQAAGGLFAINLTMLVVHWLWGAIMPRLTSAGLSAEQLMRRGLPLGVVALALVAAAGDHAGWPALAACLALASFISMAHPAVVMAFPAREAGRAATTFNLLLFAGAFGWQWLIGVAVDVLRARQWSDAAAHQAAFAALAACWALAYAWFLLAGVRERSSTDPSTATSAAGRS